MSKKQKPEYASPVRMTKEAHKNMQFLKKLYEAKSFSALINQIATERRGKLNGLFIDNRANAVLEELITKFGSNDASELIMTLGEFIETIEEEG